MDDSRALTDGGSRDGNQTTAHESTRDGERRDERPADERPAGEGPAEWLARSAVRIGIALVALVLLLFAIGQITEIDLLGEIAALLDSEIGVWLLVAVFALLLLGLAARGFSRRGRAR